MTAHTSTEHRVAAVARSYPGGPVHPATVTRHILRGVRLRDGSTLRLAARRTPGGWVVSPQSLDEFLARLTADRCGATAPATEGSSKAARRRTVERAEAELASIGI
jgi:hypothetical protein